MKKEMKKEMRLIDANELYAKLGKMAREPYYQHNGEDYFVGIANASGAVAKSPTVDAVEVVRCKDCKYYENKNINLLPHCTLCGITKFEDDFCSCGERKDNE